MPIYFIAFLATLGMAALLYVGVCWLRGVVRSCSAPSARARLEQSSAWEQKRCCSVSHPILALTRTSPMATQAERRQHCDVRPSNGTYFFFPPLVRPAGNAGATATGVAGFSGTLAFFGFFASLLPCCDFDI